jgi:hypothetical protein
LVLNAVADVVVTVAVEPIAVESILIELFSVLFVEPVDAEGVVAGFDNVFNGVIAAALACDAV